MALDKHYIRKIQSRTDKPDVLLNALTRFHERYTAGDPRFVEAIEQLGLLPAYRSYLPTAQLVSVVVDELFRRHPGKRGFMQLGFDDIKPVEAMFGETFVQLFGFDELRGMEL